MSYKEVIERYKDYMEIKNFRKETIKNYLLIVRKFTEYMKEKKNKERVQEIEKEDLREYQNMVHAMRNKRTGEAVSLSRKASIIITVRSFFRYLVKSGELLYNPASEIEVPRTRRDRLREPLKEREIKKLIEKAEGKNIIEIRDRAMLEVLYSTGIRNAELRGIKIKDVDLDHGEIKIIDGKWGKDRVVPLGRLASGYIEKYLIQSRPLLLKGEEREELFITKSGEDLGATVPIDVVKKYARKAKIKKRVTTHVIRHSCATHLLRGGADIRYVQELLGHESLDSTRIYTKIEITDLKKVHSKTHPRERA